MSIIDKCRKAITGGKWSVAYRRIGSDEWKLAYAPENQWCADPFIVEDGDNHYIFVEQYIREKGKGCIGYYQFIGKEAVNRGVIIENSYHMSYPNVFKYKEQFYMIPESSANSTVDLYVADCFPDQWHREKTLINGMKYVDSTVLEMGTQYYLISYTMIGGYEIHVFSMDMVKKELKLISKKRYERNMARPGGRIFIENGKLMRPAQDCSRKYGEALILYQIDNLNDNGAFVEHEVKRINANMFIPGTKADRIHHLTKDSQYEVIDIFTEQIDLLHAIKIYKRSRRK